MSARVGGRFAPTPLPYVDLPSLTRPQVVDEHGHELTDNELQALAAEAVATSEPPADNASDEEQGEGEEEAVPDENVEPEGTPAVPLLGLADSLVLQYSLLQSRQQHMNNLLPLIFSHPPVPGHNKPRLRLPPQRGFVFPTPPPLPQPLPSHEYHGPGNKGKEKEKEKEADGEAEANAADGEGDKPAEKTKYKRKPKKHEQAGWPAHEIECIARVTLEVGPLSFPNTELWIGQFVAPRAGAASTVRGRPKGLPRDREKRMSVTEGLLPPRRPYKRVKYDPASRPNPSPPAVPSPRPPLPSSSSMPPRPPAVGNYNSKSEIPQSLIQRVNAAASQHQWLSILIHKAARSIASKDELTKLGRVVARLGRGEGVGEGPEMPGHPYGPSAAGLVPPARPVAGPSRPPASAPPPSAPARAPLPGSLAPPLPSSSAPAVPVNSPSTVNARPHAAPIVQPPPTATPATPATPAPPAIPAAAPASKPRDLSPDSDSSLSEEEDVDMGGRPQVGGGSPGSSDPAADSTIPTSNTVKVEDRLVQPSAPATAANSATTSQPATTSQTTLQTTPQTIPQPIQIAKPPSSYASNPAFTRPPVPSSQAAYRPPPQPSSSLAPPLPSSRPPGAIPSAVPYYRQPILGAYRPPGTNTLMVPPPGVTNPIMMPPPVPRPPPPPTHPMPPPFLLVAFKDTPTEKFLLPLGPHSFISRVGEPAKPATPSPPPPAPPIPEVKDEPLPAGKKRTRGSLAKATPIPEPEPVKEATPPPPPPKKNLYADLPPVAGMHPKAGTVLLSTFVPHEQWTRPDWTILAKRLPFGNPEFIEKLNGKVKQDTESSPKGKGKVAPGSPTSPKRSLRHADDKPVPREHMLNLAAETFLPEGALEPITLRISGLTDDLWRRVKHVVDQVEQVELEAIAKQINPAPPANDPAAAPPVSTATSSLPTGTQSTPATPPAPNPTPNAPPKPVITQEVRETYLSRKKTAFTNLLSRVGPRLFPRFRVESRTAALSDALTDKWAPKPYHLTTRPLYSSGEVAEDETAGAIEIELDEPDLDINRKKKRQESAVTFEMPVSLDALDERVEAGAARGLARRGRGRGRGTPIIRKFRRGTVGATCEGCARVGVKVWRRGPNGRSTLCNACGDLWLQGTLGELKAPGAAAPPEGSATPTPGTPGTPGDGEKVKEEEEEEQGDGEGQADEAEKGDDAAEKGDDAAEKGPTTIEATGDEALSDAAEKDVQSGEPMAEEVEQTGAEASAPVAGGTQAKEDDVAAEVVAQQVTDPAPSSTMDID